MEVDLPEDGSSLEIYLISYKKNDDKTYLEGIKIYYATSWTRPEGSN